MERVSCTDTVKKLRILLVGVSHTRHLAESLEGMGAAVSLLKITSCRPTTVAMDKAAAELSAAINGDEDTIIVFQFLDKAAYYTRTEDGCLVPAQRNKDGTYHLVGDILVAPKELFLHSLKVVAWLGEVLLVLSWRDADQTKSWLCISLKLKFTLLLCFFYHPSFPTIKWGNIIHWPLKGQ